MLRTRPRPSRTLAVALAAAVPLAVPAVASAAPTTMAAATSEDAFRGEVSATGVRWRAHTVEVPAATTLTVTLDWTGAADLNVFLYDPSGRLVRSAGSRTGKPERITFESAAPGRWRVGVKAVAGDAAYTLSVDQGTVDGPPPSGPAGDFAGAVTAGGVKWRTHTFAVPSAATLHVTLDWTGDGNLNLFLYDPTGRNVAAATSRTARPERLTFPASAAGTWKLGVKAVAGGGSYSVDVRQGAPAGGGATGTATWVRTIGGPAHAQIYPSGLDVDPGGVLYVADTGNDQVAAFRPDGREIWRVGRRGAKALGSFNNPRDVAYAVVGGRPRLFVDDTGYNRIQVLDAGTGQPLAAWPHRFGSTLGVSAGTDAGGNTVILVSEDIANRILVFTPAGELVRTITGPAGTLDGPRDAATDSRGNVYVADYAHDRIVKLDPTGRRVLAAWGTHGSANGQFLRPYGVDVDDADRVYVADSDNRRIQVFTAAGAYVRTYGSRGTAPGQFGQLRRVAVGSGPAPQVWGADLWDHHVDRFGADGTFQRRYGNGAAAAGGFNEPSGLAVDSQVFVTDTVNQRIQRFSRAGVYQMMWGHRGWGKTDLGGFNWPRDLTISPSGTLWMADTKNNRVTEFTRDGAQTGRWFGLRGTSADQLHWPFGIVASGRYLYVADTFNSRVSAWDTQTLQPVWTTGTGLAYPRDVAVLGSVVYVADSNANRIVRLDAATGRLLGSFGALHSPQGVAVAADGTVWVADTNWDRLAAYSASGALLRTVGGRGAAHGRFSHPTHVEVSNGELFVSDEWNDRIEVYSLDG